MNDDHVGVGGDILVAFTVDTAKRTLLFKLLDKVLLEGDLEFGRHRNFSGFDHLYFYRRRRRHLGQRVYLRGAIRRLRRGIRS